MIPYKIAHPRGQVAKLLFSTTRTVQKPSDAFMGKKIIDAILPKPPFSCVPNLVLEEIDF